MTATPGHLLSLCLLAVVGEFIASGQDIPEARVFMGSGVLALTEQKVVRAQNSCRYSAVAENRSSFDFVFVELEVEARNGQTRIVFPIDTFDIVANGRRIVIGTCPNGLQAPDRTGLRFIRGLRTKAGEPNNESMKSLYLYTQSLPKIDGPYQSLLVSDDLKCAREYKSAVEEGGLTGRKRFQELLLFGCGKAVPGGTRVRVAKTGAEYVRVEVAEGNEELRKVKGWIHRDFVIAAVP